MRDLYVEVRGHQNGHAVSTRPADPGYHANRRAFVYRIQDVPETVSEAMAVLAFNQCSVLGHTVAYGKLVKNGVVRGEGLAWEAALGILEEL